jgi:prefoldin subunit 5
VVSACEEAKSPDSVDHDDRDDHDESPKQSPMEELEAIPKELKAQVAHLTKPIDDIQKVIDQLTSIPKRYGIDPADMIAMAKATLESGKVNVSLGADVSADVVADAKAEIENALKTLKGAVAGLKATPDRVEALLARIATLAAKVPALAAKVTASAAVAAANPLADAKAKATAQADVQKVKQVVADVMRVVSETQAKIVGIPAMATGALSKLMAALKGGDGTSPDSDDVASGDESAENLPHSKARPATTSTTAAPKGTPAQTPVATDQLALRDGTTIRGRVVKQTLTFVTIETAEGAQHTIPWDRVKEVVVAPPAKAK